MQSLNRQWHLPREGDIFVANTLFGINKKFRSFPKTRCWGEHPGSLRTYLATWYVNVINYYGEAVDGIQLSKYLLIWKGPCFLSILDSCGHLKCPWASQAFLDISFQENESIPNWVSSVEWDGLNSRCQWLMWSDFGGNSLTKLTWEQLRLCVTIWRESQPVLPLRRLIRRMVRRIQTN